MQTAIKQDNEIHPALTALFKDHKEAAHAYHALQKRGYSEADITLLMSEETKQKYFAQNDQITIPETEDKAAEGLGIGSMIGTAIGAVSAAVLAIGTSLIIPGLGLVVAGPLAAGLAGAGVGGVTGGLVGALVGSGIPDEDAQVYAKFVQNGGVILQVTPRNEKDYHFIELEWKQHKATSL